MASEKLVLTFPPRQVREPVVSRLVREHEIEVNILRANITPDEAGHMVVEFSGTKDALDCGRGYLEKVGVSWQLLSKDVCWREDLCVHCTACVSVCPSNALVVDKVTMKVSFDTEKCIGCELCIPVCMYKAMEIRF